MPAVPALLCHACTHTGAQQNGDVRLVGSSSSMQGRVEIFLSGEWGTVKFNSSSSAYLKQEGTAQVICRQLGYADQDDYGQASTMG